MSTASSTNSAGSMSSSAVVHSSLASLVASNETDKTQGATQGPSPHRRYHFSPMQTMELNNAFSQNPYPSVKYRQELATRLGIDQKTVTTWFKNQRCRLPKILRKQLLEVNGQKALTRTVPNVPKINTPALNSDSSFIQSGLQFPFYQNPEMESNLDGLKSVMLSKDKMQKALAQILQMQKGKSMADDLDSNGTKTPEAIMETDDKETNDKIDESVDVEEIEEKQLDKSDLLSIIHKQQLAANTTTAPTATTIPSFPAWNLDNYTALMHRAEKASEDDIKPNHLSSLLEEYGELLSEKAKHYLNIDFALGKDETNDSDEIVEQQPKLTEIIKNQWVEYFPKWMAGQTGSGFGGIQSLIIADQIILNRMYQDELKRRQKSN